MNRSQRRIPGSPVDRRRLLQAGATGAAIAAMPGGLAFAQSGATPSASPVVGLDTLLPPIVEERMATLLIPGAVVLVRTPDTEFLEAFGTRIVGEDVPVTTDDHFRVGSNTKPMTGTVLLQLVEEGLIALDDPVSTSRPDVPNGDSITIAQLLEMRSGLFSYTLLRTFNEIMDKEPRRVWEPEELVAIGLAEPPDFAPGAEFQYSNTNTVLAGLIAEQLTGKPLATLFAERLFEPLRLTETVFPDIDDASIPDPHPHGYMYGTNVSTFDTPVLSEEDQAAARAGELLPNDQTGINPSWAWAAGSASSTASDLATFVEALVGGGLHGEAMQATRLASLQPIIDTPGALEYGLTIARFGPLIGHTGSLPGYQSFMGHDADAGVTVVVLTNLQFAPNGLETANQIVMPLIGTLYGG
jgi:D-alanyl-D-alanine carboxypeptidase